MLLVKCDIHWILCHHIWGKTHWRCTTHISTYSICAAYLVKIRMIFQITYTIFYFSKIKYSQTGWINFWSGEEKKNESCVFKIDWLLLFIVPKTYSIMQRSHELWSTCMYRWRRTKVRMNFREKNRHIRCDHVEIRARSGKKEKIESLQCAI